MQLQIERDHKVAPPNVVPIRKRAKLYYERFGSVAAVTENVYLLDDLLDAGALSVIYGDSNVGKSFLALDIAFHIATGTAWNGNKVKAGLVVYVAAEGGIRNRNRLVALRNHFGVNDVPIALVPCPINLLKGSADVMALVALIRRAETDFGTTCALLVIDTLARATQGGDENNGVDMGGFIGNVDAIRNAIKAHIMLVHHTGKDKARGARGWSGIRAAIDTEIEVADGAMTATKQRDLDTVGKARAFELVPVEVGTRDDGRPVTSCVVRWNPGAPPLASSGTKRTDTEILQSAILAAYDHLAEHGEHSTGFDRKPVVKVGINDIREEVKSRGFLDIDEKGSIIGTSRERYRRAKAGLLGAKNPKLVENKGLIWRP
ncbi:MAG: AAA family ATPase [Hyphomicrobiales bacterium]|nr:AAA family ATPase [Hyphomicrobiales bacterium]